jgi:hypothetical protein
VVLAAMRKDRVTQGRRHECLAANSGSAAQQS